MRLCMKENRQEIMTANIKTNKLMAEMNVSLFLVSKQHPIKL